MKESGMSICTNRQLQTNHASALQAYVQKLAQCLLHVEDNTDGNHSSLTQLRQWSVEANAFFICFGMGSPRNKGILHSLNMEDGTLYQEPPPDNAAGELLVRCACD